MTSIISLGCDIADIHHQYAAIHGALFGAASYRMVLASLTGRTVGIYREYQQTLEQLQVKLSGLAGEIATADAGSVVHQADQLRGALSEYVDVLDTSISGLREMCARLLEDENAYRDTPAGGQSEFNRDKVHYDGVLLQLERLGHNLNTLFSRF